MASTDLLAMVMQCMHGVCGSDGTYSILRTYNKIQSIFLSIYIFIYICVNHKKFISVLANSYLLHIVCEIKTQYCIYKKMAPHAAFLCKLIVHFNMGYLFVAYLSC